MRTDAVVILSTAPPGEAADIARQLVEERLAACVQLAGIRSVYRWKGKIEDEPEELLVIKTQRPLAGSVVARIRDLHGYEVPEAIVLPVESGSEEYLDWLATETRRGP
ncbi:MAG: divalent-cation tolerance protein CutA [Methanospirillum sp.]|nr:divalent-cation tolerance protein CutA [Methanospirillum sp.]